MSKPKNRRINTVKGHSKGNHKSDKIVGSSRDGRKWARVRIPAIVFTTNLAD